MIQQFKPGPPRHSFHNWHLDCKSCGTRNHESRKNCIGCGAEM